MLAELLSLVHTVWPGGGLLGHSWISLRGSLTRKVGRHLELAHILGPALMLRNPSTARRDENWRGNCMRP